MRISLFKRAGFALIVCAALLWTSTGSATPLAAPQELQPTPPGWIWRWRQPPFEYIVSDPMPYVRLAAWGGADYDVLYAGTISDSDERKYPPGVYRSIDQGITWEHLGKIDAKQWMTRLLVHPNDGNIIFAGFESRYNDGGGLYRSEDAGKTWANILPTLWIKDIEVDPSNPNHLYVAAITGGPWPPLPGGLYESTDAGKTWERISALDFDDVAVHPTAPNILFGGNPWEGGIERSDDGGRTWTHNLRTRNRSIVIDQHHPDRMYAFGGDYDELWRTLDGGVTWTNIGESLPEGLGTDPTVYAVSVDPVLEDTLWIATKYTGVFRSDDLGANWYEVNTGIYQYSTFGASCTTLSITSHEHAATACYGLLFVGINLPHHVTLPIARR